VNLRILLLAAVLLCVPAARAQDAAAPAPENATAAGTVVEPAPAPEDEPLTAPPAETTKATGPSPDSFKPSEEISEDLSVSFPVDI